MARNKLTIKLTDDQQKQIRDATGKSIKELNIDLGAMGRLTDEELENVTGGRGIIAFESGGSSS